MMMIQPPLNTAAHRYPAHQSSGRRPLDAHRAEEGAALGQAIDDGHDDVHRAVIVVIAVVVAVEFAVTVVEVVFVEFVVSGAGALGNVGSRRANSAASIDVAPARPSTSAATL